MCKKEITQTVKTTVKTIVTAYLVANKYDGLFHPTVDCGCFLCDLMPCDYDIEYCQPGYKKMNDDGDWIIKPNQ